MKLFSIKLYLYNIKNNYVYNTKKFKLFHLNFYYIY